ncbi:hypothetical protein Goklo_028501 [Gossypium klotzschianum]|uniref:Uncharacterized protein n=1 Tax=Gossypium klotzschianum TaxID=34286 RepID=A0A7J8U221_9ROSI|nr:hypothetical protein [Gossypium klotzschianum]
MDFNIDSGIIGKFARLAVYVNLDEPLVFQAVWLCKRGIPKDFYCFEPFGGGRSNDEPENGSGAPSSSKKDKVVDMGESWANGRGNGGKAESNRNGKILNKTIRGHKDRFKAIGNSRTFLSDTINFMAKFISSQIDVVDDTGTLPRNGKGLGSLSFAKQ